MFINPMEVNYLEYIQALDIAEELFEFENGRIYNQIIINCHADIDPCPAKTGLYYLIALPLYGAFSLTKQIGRALMPYPDGFAVCYDRVVKNNITLGGSCIRHVKTNCAQFTVKIYGSELLVEYRGRDGICVFDEYFTCANMFSRLIVESEEQIGQIMIGEIFLDAIDIKSKIARIYR